MTDEADLILALIAPSFEQDSAWHDAKAVYATKPRKLLLEAAAHISAQRRELEAVVAMLHRHDAPRLDDDDRPLSLHRRVDALHDEWRDAAQAAESRATRAEAALAKIDAIRNSIIGCQKVNWSEHVYPLVAALGEAGLQGQEYEVARENVGTLIERTNAAEALLAEAVAGLGRITSDHTSDPNYPQGHAWDASCDACNGREIARTLLALIIQTGDGNISSISQSARTKEPIALARPDTEPSGQEGGAA